MAKGTRGRKAQYGEPMIRVSTRIPVSVFDRIDQKARESQVSLHEYVRRLAMRDVPLRAGETR